MLTTSRMGIKPNEVNPIKLLRQRFVYELHSKALIVDAVTRPSMSIFIDFKNNSAELGAPKDVDSRKFTRRARQRKLDDHFALERHAHLRQE